ncbi:hypothetical protein C8R46DRAFT_1363324 [Mycena filopes]|nr:hypothetical protein C8R46DRAFT_1363282 [Mycena filopes]KAJ7129108.1 hypothetical protein C8R46DRAFT_1363324 [Mycena filopes]
MARNSGNTAARHFTPRMYVSHGARPRAWASPGLASSCLRIDAIFTLHVVFLISNTLTLNPFNARATFDWTHLRIEAIGGSEAWFYGFRLPFGAGFNFNCCYLTHVGVTFQSLGTAITLVRVEASGY